MGMDGSWELSNVQEYVIEDTISERSQIYKIKKSVAWIVYFAVCLVRLFFLTEQYMYSDTKINQMYF